MYMMVKNIQGEMVEERLQYEIIMDDVEMDEQKIIKTNLNGYYGGVGGGFGIKSNTGGGGVNYIHANNCLLEEINNLNDYSGYKIIIKKIKE